MTILRTHMMTFLSSVAKPEPGPETQRAASFFLLEPEPHRNVYFWLLRAGFGDASK
jgi:hypothetical protein